MSKKNDAKVIFKSFSEQGCELLEPYIDAKTKMKYRCQCGRISSISWNKFSQGRRCGYCHKTGRKKKYTLEEVRNIFLDRGCVLLEKEYKNQKIKMKYICKCGGESQITFTAFLHQRQTCIKCAAKKRTGPKNHMWIENRSKVAFNRWFRRRCSQLLWSVLRATGQKKNKKARCILGYTTKELKDHLTSHKDWNKVKNRDWSIDHVFPIKAFLDHGIKDISLINCLENLRPMTLRANKSKNCRYNEKEFLLWLESKNYSPNNR